MAFSNKLGCLLKQSISRNSLQSGIAPATYLFNSIRSMSSSKLFVGGLSVGTDDTSLKEAFDSFGYVTEARVITDRDSGRSRGFGFVSFDSKDSATTAMSSMDGKELHGRNIRVSYAQERQGAGGGGGFRGGYGSGGGGGSYGGGARGGYGGGFGDQE
ncbi:glycine-rich RNA-binding protein 4, mitochondrial-like [Iris pallida]|uniref:Glycine-rich RNA-binding protein 4, mitochondrial-like n=1 Tax=Iris pallida TaxID=29817 RepID=A0AAX6HYT7_IRIPA|nr:glycine-rich RNA-binding protein 4, mitochondrial-like [Iris pallida]KAJ6846082.1 glycine-rich RNA-binding protein 4, mitochondrial-like [Iris pallida]